jgi:hypothetical protein
MLVRWRPAKSLTELPWIADPELNLVPQRVLTLVLAMGLVAEWQLRMAPRQRLRGTRLCTRF